MRTFLMHRREQKIPYSEEENAVLNAIEYDKWRNGGKTDYKVSYINPSEGYQIDLSRITPAGSIEFINGLLKSTAREPLKAINIPDDLNFPIFLRRGIWRYDSLKDLESADANDAVRFVKPGNTIKLFSPVICKISRLREKGVPDDVPLFVSEDITKQIVSEWRVFVYGDDIIDIKPYILDGWVMPDKPFVQLMIKQWKNDVPPAYTLDVAVLSSGETVLIEAHNFVACGLYGFDAPRLLPMMTSAWLWELNQRISGDYFGPDDCGGIQGPVGENGSKNE